MSIDIGKTASSISKLAVTFKKALIITVGVIMLLMTLLGFYQASLYGNAKSIAIKTFYKNIRNIHGQYVASAREITGVRELSVSDQERIIVATFGGEGRAGNQAAMQWITEHNLPYNATIVNRLAEVVELSRNKIANHTTGLLAECQDFETQLGTPFRGTFLSILGYPDKRIEGDYTLAKMCDPIESSHTAEVFDKTGTDDGISFK